MHFLNENQITKHQCDQHLAYFPKILTFFTPTWLLGFSLLFITYDFGLFMLTVLFCKISTSKMWWKMKLL